MTRKKVDVRQNNLRKLRKLRRLTQIQVGKFLGIDNSAVSRHEASSRGLTKELIKLYADLYEVHTVSILVNLPADDDSMPHVNT